MNGAIPLLSCEHKIWLFGKTVVKDADAPCFLPKKRDRMLYAKLVSRRKGHNLDQSTNSTEAAYSDLTNDDDLRDIVALFVEEMEGRIAKIEAEFASSDLYSLGRTVHQLKGAAGSYGFAEITQAAIAVEEKIRDAASDKEIETSVKGLVALCRLIKAEPTRF